MSYEAEAAAIRTHFKQAWGTTTPIAYENAPFNPPSGPWVRLTILNGEAFQADMADAPRYRHPGVVMVQVFAQHGTGDGKARELGEKAAGVFRGRNIGGAVFSVKGSAPSARPQGSDGTWYSVLVTAPFYRDTIY